MSVAEMNLLLFLLGTELFNISEILESSMMNALGYACLHQQLEGLLMFI